MKIKHNDLIPEKDKAFEKCKLGREKYAKVLTSIVESYADGFVLAINNEWGAGKTTFVKMWKQYLDDREFDTLYFNAWENDFEDNPLVAIMAELKTLFPKNNKSTYENLTKKAAILFKNILPAVAKGVAKKYIDSETLVDGIEEATKGATEILKDEIDIHLAKKKGLIDFREELERFVAEHNNSKPLIFIIDELDRCRPDYAVKVLEHVKHFFGVSGIVFVLSIDKIQLGNSIRGFYGSENIDSNNYLKRFIDLEYRIPQPLGKDCCNYFYQYYDFASFFSSNARQRYFGSNKEFEEFLEFTNVICEKENLTMRQIEKLFAHCRLALKQFEVNHFVFPRLLFFLVYLREYELIFYKKIFNRVFSVQDLVSEIEILFSKISDNNTESLFLWIEALLIKLYTNYCRDLNFGVALIQADSEGRDNLTFNTNNNNNEIIRLLKYFQQANIGGASLSHILNKVDLMEDLIT